jgi:hypothetical protein
MKFNHTAHRLIAHYADTTIDMFVTRLGFVVLRRTERAVFLRQPGANVDLQLSLVATAHRDDDKRRSQVSFLSDTPEADLNALAAWAGEHGMAASVGAYSHREFYLDAPDAFVDFVIEAMLPELADYGVEV